MTSPFWHYNCCAGFDPIALIKKYAVTKQKPTKSFITNFLGVLIDPKFFPGILDGREDTVEGLPIPANFHADVAEWGAALRAVELSGETFTMIELGCGWGCWMNNTGKVAKRLGKKCMLIGVEGDEGYIQFAKECLTINGFKSKEYKIIHGIAAAKNGFALFPKQKFLGESYGLEPKFCEDKDKIDRLLATGKYYKLKMISLSDIMELHSHIDLLHMDIQGGELSLINDAIEVINRKVSYLVIGTHSRQIEGKLFDTLISNGWILEIERPAILSLEKSVPYVIVDGVQGWNPTIFEKNLNKIIMANSQGLAKAYLKSGWSIPEPEFTWSEGNMAVIEIPVSNTLLDKDLTVVMNFIPFGKQNAIFYINDKKVYSCSIEKEKEIKLNIEKKTL